MVASEVARHIAMEQVGVRCDLKIRGQHQN